MGLHKLEYCKKGLHELKGTNAVPKKDGTRTCRACRKAYRAIFREAQKIKKEALRKHLEEVARWGRE